MATPQKITDQHAAKILRLLKAGCSRRETAKYMGLSKSSVTNAIDRGRDPTQTAEFFDLAMWVEDYELNKERVIRQVLDELYGEVD